VNPYAYVGNRPLNAIDPTGYQSLPDLGGPGVPVLQLVGYAQLVFGIGDLLSSWLPRGGLPPPPATAVPGQSAQNGTGLCGPGTFSPICGGMVLYAGAPTAGDGALPTSTWGATSVEDMYARENLEQLFIDLGINAVDVLILSPVRDAQAAYEAARNGDYIMVGVYAGMTICELAKPCEGAVQATKAIRKLANAAPKVKYIGKLDDLKGIPHDKTLLDQLPDQGSVKANYRQNSSVLRGAVRDGYQIRDASVARANSQPDPTLRWPTRKVNQSFLGVERLIMKNKGYALDENGIYVPR
jgi:hypothetical protein